MNKYLRLGNLLRIVFNWLTILQAIQETWLARPQKTYNYDRRCRGAGMSYMARQEEEESEVGGATHF